MSMVKRSGLYYLLSPIVPINHALKAKVDVWGSVLIVGLAFGTVSAVRMLLAWAQ